MIDVVFIYKRQLMIILSLFPGQLRWSLWSSSIEPISIMQS